MPGPVFSMITIDDELLRSLRPASGVLVATGQGRDRGVEVARRAGSILAAKLRTPLFLSDRSRRTWGDTPHTKGPLDVDAVRRAGWHHLEREMDEALALGAPSVRVVVPSIPTADAVSSAIAVSGASVVVTPAAFERRRLLDRWQLRAGLGPVVKRHAGETTVLAARPGGLLVEVTG